MRRGRDGAADEVDLAPTVRLRRLTRADFSLLACWLATPHVARWWAHETTAEAIEADFGPAIDGLEPTCQEIALAEGGAGADAVAGAARRSSPRPLGFLQRYRYADYPGDLSALRGTGVDVPRGAHGIDYFVGEPSLLRRGWGTRLIHAGVDAAWRADASAIVVAVHADNAASQRVLARAGFRVAGRGELEPDNPVDGRAHVVLRIDRPAG